MLSSDLMMSVLKRLSKGSFLLSLCLIAGFAHIYGQMRVNQSGTGGINEVRGRIYLPDGSSGNEQIKVELQSNNFSTLSLYTDRGGSFSFQNLAPGAYSVVVEAGERFETFRESFTIDTDAQLGPVRIQPTPKIITVPVYLRIKNTVRSEKAAVINAKWGDVSKPAIDAYIKATEKLASKQFSDAESLFRRAISLAPDFAPPYSGLGKLMLMSDNLTEAAEHLKRAAALDPDDFETRLNYGITLLNQRQFSSAESELKAAARLDSTAVTPRYYLGIVFIQTKELDKAQAELEDAKKLAAERSFPLLHRYLGGVYQAKGKNQLAVSELETYLRLAPAAKDADKIRSIIQELKAAAN